MFGMKAESTQDEGSGEVTESEVDALGIDGDDNGAESEIAALPAQRSGETADLEAPAPTTSSVKPAAAKPASANPAGSSSGTRAIQPIKGFGMTITPVVNGIPIAASTKSPPKTSSQMPSPVSPKASVQAPLKEPTNIGIAGGAVAVAAAGSGSSGTRDRS